MDLGNYADLPNALNFHTDSNNLTLDNLYKVFGKLPKFPTDIKVNRGSTQIHEGVEITELSWSTGYGPLTQSYLLKPAGVDKKLPVVLFLHSHDDLKGYGKEKLVDTKDGVPADLVGVRRDHYGNRAAANELAKRGYVVLTFDCFMWGSRNFSFKDMPGRLKEILGRDEYESLAVMHESMVLSKYLSLFGTTLAGLLNFDDRVALSVAKSLPEGDGQIAVMGLSGGGCRTLYLHATNSDITASVSVGAMATYQSLLDIHVAPHSWMFFPQNLAQFGDWPDVALLGGPKNLYIQYCGDDQLFTKAGMKDADSYINNRYESGKYQSSFYPVKHSFTKDMQEDAFNWLDQVMEK